MTKSPPIQPSQDQLNESWEHVLYECSMLQFCKEALVDDNPPLGSTELRNAVLESFAMHARALAAFLFDQQMRPADVTASQLVPTASLSAWQQARGPKPLDLDLLATQASKQVAHLTFDRSPRPDDKNWDVAKIYATLGKIAQELLKYGPTRETWSFRFPPRTSSSASFVGTGVSHVTITLLDNLNKTVF